MENKELLESFIQGQPSDQLAVLVKLFADHMSILRLPPPEPGVFAGDPLRYGAWKCAFEMLIGSKIMSSVEKLHYLKKYLSGQAKEAVNGYFYLLDESSFENAMEVLGK